MNSNKLNAVNDFEVINILLKDIYERYGYDFQNYSRASIVRRLENILNKEKMASIHELHFKIIHNPIYFNTFLQDITVTFTEMFRDPIFFKTIRNKIIPDLQHLKKIRIWHAGCSSGEEVYSMAMLLKEEELLHKTQLYATDINKKILYTAKKADFLLKNIESYENNYIEAGGKSQLLNYFNTNEYNAKVKEEIKSKIIFSEHNLTEDQSFNEFHLIICRNVLIYFNKELQNKVIKLFCNSLPSLGYLALGTKETIAFSDYETKFSKIIESEKIWQLI